jgi:hypothetical protein
MGRFTDFDAIWREHNNERVPVKVLGKDYSLPVELPAALVLRFMRLQDGRDITASDLEQGGTIADIIDLLFGAGTMATWLGEGITFPQLTQIIQYVASGYQSVEAPIAVGGDEATPLTSSGTGA